MKIYTRGGDKGTTSTLDGREKKFAPVFDLLGDLDELSAHIGELCALFGAKELGSGPDTTYNNELRTIQKRIYDLNALLSTNNPSRRERMTRMDGEPVKCLESYIDSMTDQTPPLKDFILPGVTIHDAKAQVCRSVARRAERKMWQFLEESPDYLNQHESSYVNRLSDFFFALARYYCALARRADICAKYYEKET